MSTNARICSSVGVHMDPSDKPGRHWMAIYIEDGCGDLFDSFGHGPFPMTNNESVVFKCASTVATFFDSSVVQMQHECFMVLPQGCDVYVGIVSYRMTVLG